MGLQFSDTVCSLTTSQFCRPHFSPVLRLLSVCSFIYSPSVYLGLLQVLQFPLKNLLVSGLVSVNEPQRHVHVCVIRIRKRY